MTEITQKNILFTLWYAGGYHGGVMYVAELGEYFKLLGWNVYCATVTLNEEIKEYWQNKGIEVYLIDKLPVENINYDIVWHMHFPTLSYLILKGLKYSKIIYNSLSAFLDLETPPVHASEFNLILAVSIECKNSLIKRAKLSEASITVLNNMVPEEYFKNSNSGSKKTSKIAIVSNHPPKELLDSVEIFKKENIKVDIYGQKHFWTPITPILLSKYDATITIGKTVQYSLALGIPCYNYDYFGGSGYITVDNINKEEEFNFSGRSYKTKKTADEIVTEVTSYYSDVLAQTQKLKQIAYERYLLSSKVNQILNKLEETSDIKIDIEKYHLNLIQSRFIVEEVLKKNSVINNKKKKNKRKIYLKYYIYKLINLLLFGKNTYFLNKYNFYKIQVKNIKITDVCL